MALTEKDKKTLLILVVVLVLFGIYYAYSEIYPKLNEIDDKIKTKEDAIKQAKEKLKELGKIRNELVLLEAELNQIKKYFPVEEVGQKKTIELLTKLETLGKKLNINFKQISFANEQEWEGGLYKEVKMTIVPKEKLKMDMIIKLLYAFDKYENILDIKKFNITPDATYTLFDVRLDVSFYMFKPEAFK